MKKFYTLIVILVTGASAKAQQVVIFNDSMNSASYWQMNVPTGMNGNMPDMWVMNDMEGGVAPGGCQQMMNGDMTLHVTMPMAMSGATYTPQVTTHMRAQMNSGINTTGITQLLMLTFDYVAGGINGMDYSTIQYSTDAGTSWNNVSNINSSFSCNNQKQWSTAVVMLPAACSNIQDLRIGFNWTNNGDGNGSNPSVAINNLKISYQSMSTGIGSNEISENEIYSDGPSVIVNTPNDFRVLAVTNIGGQLVPFEKNGNKLNLKNKFEGILFVAIEMNGNIIRKKIMINNF